jgi:anti-anti-sigma factor
MAHLGTAAPAIGSAIGRGQLELRSAQESYLPDGRLEIERMLELLRDEHATALADGYAGLSTTGDMSWALSGAPGCEDLLEYERRLEAMPRPDTLRMLCRYDHARHGAGGMAAMKAVHELDVSPAMAAIGRIGDLSAAQLVGDGTLRLAGELDFESADALVSLLAAQFHGELRLDLADLSFVDVAGMRALRGRTAQQLRLVAASDSVTRLLELLAWDTDPAVAWVPDTELAS